jgi:4-amino-4-deoxychorismate lyase
MSNNSYDDIIIERGGLLTDTTIANIAFFDGKEWITPKKPLLEGSLRAKLLDNKILVKKDIKIDSLKHFSHYALMNAMIGFRIQKDVTIYINEKEKICL